MRQRWLVFLWKREPGGRSKNALDVKPIAISYAILFIVGMPFATAGTARSWQRHGIIQDIQWVQFVSYLVIVCIIHRLKRCLTGVPIGTASALWGKQMIVRRWFRTCTTRFRYLLQLHLFLSPNDTDRMTTSECLLYYDVTAHEKWHFLDLLLRI